ncbi:diaminopimelate epimerase [Thalassobaculum litoreum]|uniref:Diaminopimelate epimerase n=1 Tax=Thalassobaculum litoreum DSM 18839 TaxID=1123362 RepID=A0A8G2BKW8_9PROT|nr:diaminopimelate epimerase [Thalassobaculum litoreum]SDG21689.1 diaminopimelate epimerase [Thalassobaculum litoreum DSM 18839]
MSTNLPFLKMHGLGNDFVVVDGRKADAALSEAQYRAVGDRRRGVGYDQFLTILPPKNGGLAYMAIHNPDGSQAQACGNGTRCVASLLMDEAGAEEIVLETVVGGLVCKRAADGRVTVDMGKANLGWTEIPIAVETDTREVTVPGAEAYGPATMVNMGNPHAVFFVEDAEALDLARIGPPIETNPIFPERANIEFVSVLAPDRLRMRVWERGAGITQACGSGACATVVAAARRGMIPGRSASVVLDGGVLDITWRADGHVEMTGPVATSFSGTLDLSALGS